jgi:hypothetical protein
LVLQQTRTTANFDWPATAVLTNGFSGDDMRRFARDIAAQQFRRFKVRPLLSFTQFILTFFY